MLTRLTFFHEGGDKNLTVPSFMYTAPNTDTFLLEYSLQQSAGPNLQFFF